MKRKNATRSALFTSVISLLLCVSMLVGTTFAWFTDSVVSGNNVIVAGNLDIDVMYANTPNGTYESIENVADLFVAPSGATKGLWEPGHTEVAYLKIVNNGTLALKYQFKVDAASEVIGTSVLDNDIKLSEILKFAATDPSDTAPVEYTRATAQAAAEEAAANLLGYATKTETLAPGAAHYIALVVYLPETTGNEANYRGDAVPTINFKLTALATQVESESDSFGNDYDENADFAVVDAWDGTADTSWYDPANPLNEYRITTAEQLAGLAELVSGNTTFDDVTFTLGNDIDLYCEDTSPSADGDPVTFRPIGDHSKNGTFEGTFDGDGKTIFNLYQNGWDLGYEWGVYGSYGLFGNLNNATVKNLTLSGGESYIEGGDVSFVAGSATGTCVFENITIEDSVAATYNNGCGGIIGWSGAGNYTFKNITIAEDAVLAGLWGSFDSSIGGIVGQGEPGATYNFENVNIACRIDAYNDCTASYDYYNYRMCGMIIGRLEETTTIDGVNYPDTSKYNITCNNVTVTYGDWANYHYCRANGARAQRVEAGYSYGGVATDYDHSTCTAHHMELIAFDQIFGGDQYAVKGLKAYGGVTVIYDNK